MSHQELLDYGFKQFNNTIIDKYDILFQLPVRDKIGIRFYCNVRFWQNSKYSPEAGDGYDAKVNFNEFVVQLYSVNDMKPKDVVAFFDKMWEKMGCSYYDQ